MDFKWRICLQTQSRDLGFIHKKIDGIKVSDLAVWGLFKLMFSLLT